MRAAWSTLIAVGAFLIVGAVGAFLLSEHLDDYGTFTYSSRGEMHVMALETRDRVRNLIGHLQRR